MTTIFCVRPQGFNVGNDVIFLGMQSFLYEAFGKVVNIISLPATSRYESQLRSGLTAKTVHDINQYGHGVILGGGNLYENGELDLDLEALEALEAPLMLFSLSRGRIYNRQHRLVDRTNAMPASAVIALNRKARYSLTRDEATQTYLRSLEIKKSEMGGCPSLFINRLVNRLPKLSPGDRTDVLISVRHPALMNIPLRQQAQVTHDLVEIIEFLRGEGFADIRLLCHDQRDIPFAASFTGVEYVYTGDIYSYLALLRSCSLNVTYRLHAALPCLSFGTPTIKISYDERAISLMETIGLGTWNLNMMDSEAVVAQVRERYRRLDILEQLRNQAQPIWNQLNTVMRNAFCQFAADVLAYQDGECCIEPTTK